MKSVFLRKSIYQYSICESSTHSPPFNLRCAMSRRAQRRKKAAASAAAAAPTTTKQPSPPQPPPVNTLTPTSINTDVNIHSATPLSVAFLGVDTSLVEYYENLRQSLLDQISTSTQSFSEAADEFAAVVTQTLLDSSVVASSKESQSLVIRLLTPFVSDADAAAAAAAAAAVAAADAANAAGGGGESKQKANKYFDQNGARGTTVGAGASTVAESLSILTMGAVSMCCVLMMVVFLIVLCFKQSTRQGDKIVLVLWLTFCFPLFVVVCCCCCLLLVACCPFLFLSLSLFPFSFF